MRRIANLKSFHFNYTYEGLIAGNHGEHHNEYLRTKLNYPDSWPETTVLLIIPPKEEYENELKPTRYCAYLESTPINLNDELSDGSSLVVIWFGEEPKSN